MRKNIYLNESDRKILSDLATALKMNDSKVIALALSKLKQDNLDYVERRFQEAHSLLSEIVTDLEEVQSPHPGGNNQFQWMPEKHDPFLTALQEAFDPLMCLNNAMILKGPTGKQE